jgi:hypothetical protein
MLDSTSFPTAEFSKRRDGTDHDMDACMFMSFRESSGGGRRNVENEDGKDKEIERDTGP